MKRLALPTSLAVLLLLPLVTVSAQRPANAPDTAPAGKAPDTVFIEELTWLEVRDAIRAGKKNVIVATGGIEQNGPYLTTGKHNFVLRATTEANEECDFAATGKTITDPGFLKAYVESTDDAESADDAEHRLPALTKGQPLTADALEALGHSTQPPARYTEPSLVKALEELGIGRPSTYASIMQTIQDRGYVFKRGQALFDVTH